MSVSGCVFVRKICGFARVLRPVILAIAVLTLTPQVMPAKAQTYGNPVLVPVGHKAPQRYWMPGRTAPTYSREYYNRYRQPLWGGRPVYRQPAYQKPRYRVEPAPRAEKRRIKKTLPRVTKTKARKKAPVIAWKTEDLPEGPVQLVISLPDQKMTVYQGGQAVVSTPVSTGKPGYDTPAGVFSVLEKRRVHFSRKYDDAPMPNMQRLTWSGIALHGGRVPGYAASHGCIRLPHGFAKELFAFTERGAQVIVAQKESKPVKIDHAGLLQPTTLAQILGRKPNSGMQSDVSPMPALPVTETQVASLVTQASASEVASAPPEAAAVEDTRSPAEMLGDLEATVDRLAAFEKRSDAPLRIAITRWTMRERVVAIQRLLDELGYEPGPVDGQAGSRTIGAIKAYEKANALPVTGMVTDGIVASLTRATGRPAVDNGHLYVRQNGKPLFDAAVAIRDDGRALGTHIFTALDFKPDTAKANWTAMTLNGAAGDDASEPVPTAQEALDRVVMADHVRIRLSDLLTPGSTIIVTDSGISNETLRGTDLVVEVK